MAGGQCVDFPKHLLSNTCFYVTNVIITPVLLGIGIIANLICLIVINSAQIRKYNPAFAYINALITMDLLSLLLLVPQFLRDSEVLPPDINHSRIMGYIMTMQNGLSPTCMHAATWFIVMAIIVFIAKTDTKRMKQSWTKIAVSRIIAFIIFVAALILNFPRFFQYSVHKVVGHCFYDMELWYLRLTLLGESVLFTGLYPWIVIGVAFATPYLTMIFICVAVPVKLGNKPFCQQKVVLENANNDDDRKLHLGKCLFMLAIVLIILEVPHNIVKLFLTLNEERARASAGFYEFSLIAELLRRVRISIPFLIYVLYYGDFRKCLRRMFCCSGDEYYEPFACCCRPSLAKELEKDSKKNGKHERKVNGHVDKRHHSTDRHKKASRERQNGHVSRQQSVERLSRNTSTERQNGHVSRQHSMERPHRELEKRYYSRERLNGQVVMNGSRYNSLDKSPVRQYGRGGYPDRPYYSLERVHHINRGNFNDQRYLSLNRNNGQLYFASQANQNAIPNHPNFNRPRRVSDSSRWV